MAKAAGSAYVRGSPPDQGDLVMSKTPPTRPDERSPEIEILPPSPPRSDPRSQSRARIWIGGTNGVRVIKVGPVGAALLALGFAVVMALGFIFLTSAMIVLLPIVLVLAAISYLTGASGNPFRRLP
jgi:hypothetical protein